MKTDLKSKRNIGEWITKRCSIKNKSAETRLCNLYGDYFEWCLAKSDRFMTRGNFNKTLLRMGFKTRREKTARLLLGISLND